MRNRALIRTASLDAVEAAAEDWTPGQIDCRSLTGHNWQPRNARLTGKGRTRVLVITQRCPQCHNTRHRAMHPDTGRWVDDKWSTGYFEGYLMPKGSGRVDEEGKSLLRLMAVSHLVVQEGDQ